MLKGILAVVVSLCLLFTPLFSPAASARPTEIYAHKIEQTKHHSKLRKIEKIVLVYGIGARAFDAGQTAHNLATGGHENFMPSQSPAVCVLWIAGLTIGEQIGTHELRKHGHRKLALIISLASPAGSVRGIIYSKQHGAW